VSDSEHTIDLIEMLKQRAASQDDPLWKTGERLDRYHQLLADAMMYEPDDLVQAQWYEQVREALGEPQFTAWGERIKRNVGPDQL
jgi:hypothetical protein